MNTERINTFPFVPFQFPFNIEIAGKTDCDNPYITNRKNSYCYILEYIIDGSGFLICNGKKYEVNKGDVYLLPKGSNHEYHAKKRWKKIWFNMDGLLVSNLLVAYGIENEVVFRCFNHAELFDSLYDITQMETSPEKIMQKASLKFHEIVQELHTIVTKRAIPDNINIIRQMLDNAVYSDSMHLSDIADNLHLSQVQIINSFKKVFGVTPHQYLEKKKIEAGAHMLSASDVSIQEISRILHYSDASYFSNAFKKTFGISPKKYRMTVSKSTMDMANANIKTMTENGVDNPYNLIVNRR